MSTTTVIIVQGGYSVDTVRSNVIATGVALLFAYATNFIIQGVLTFLYKQENKGQVMKRVVQTCRVLYWFGIAVMFSVYPAFYWGIHSSVLAWLTMVLIIIPLHIFCFIDKSIKQRSLWSIFYMIYHILITIWILIALIAAYIWSGQSQGRSV